MNAVRSSLTIIGFITLSWFALKELDAAAFGAWGFGADATDGRERSGLALRTDYQTGCQYLVSPWGGITARLAPDGKQICN